jgi:3-isopropylmalate/(R)-2-methylmalate dehydratase large subunit
MMVTVSSRDSSLEFLMKVLYLSQSLELLNGQLAGERCTLKQAGVLRSDVSTDEITPVAMLSYYDRRLAQFAHTGLTIEGERPIKQGALEAAGVEVLVAGARYGKGSSREHSPVAELWAGVKIVFAESFERIYRQNADNIGLITSTNFKLLERLERGENIDLLELTQDREPLAKKLVHAGGLLKYGQQIRKSSVGVDQSRFLSAKPKTLFEKIVERHLLDASVPPQEGEGVFVKADWRFIHEYYTGMAAHMLDQTYGDTLAIQDPDSVIVFEDHTSYVDESPAHVRLGLVPNMLAMQQAQRRFVARHSLRQHQTQTEQEVSVERSSNQAGISHAMMAEHYVLPGQLVAGTDSHTPHSGALGCVAFGVGTTDMANALVTGAVRLTFDASVKIGLSGKLPSGVTAKDVVLHLLALPWIRAGGGIGKVFEFCGSVVNAMSIDERATLTNMTAELGGLTGIVASDQTTVEFLLERRSVEFNGVEFKIQPWMQSDEGASYEHHLDIDCTQLSPMLASPGDPGNGLPIDQLPNKVNIDIAYGGSCTAGKREDFDRYHEVLAWGLSHGLKLPTSVQLFLQYGTTAVRDYCESRHYDKTFQAVGARMLQPSCGACANCGPGSSTDKEQVTVSAINRNFPGRSGPGQVWLASPPTVVASALAGYLCSFEQLKAHHASAVHMAENLLPIGSRT